MSRRLAAIMVADVVGYSRLMEADETATLAALRERRKSIVEPLVREHSGRIVKFLGDGVLVEFASAVNAVKAAIELQRQFALTNEALAEISRIVLRIGINLGEVVGEGSDIFGDGVNIAARLEVMAEAGGICLSGKVHDEIKGKFEFSADDMGEVVLKNISRPVRVFHIRSHAAAKLVPASPVASAQREYTAVAVLPFVNMSGNPNQDYFADGITEDIITELSRFKHLSVVARNTTFTYKGRAVNVPEVGRQLGADFVVEGSIRLAGERVRVSVQLIDAQTGAHTFAEKFDRKMEDIFEVQDDIVEAIIARLSFNIDEAAAIARARNPTTSASAYTCWLRGRAAWRNGNERLAREYMHEAIHIDPTYARALADISFFYGYWRFSQSSAVANAERTEHCRQFAQRAVAADISDPFVLDQVSVCFLMLGEIDTALRYSGMVFSMGRRDPGAGLGNGVIKAFAGRHEEGLKLVERACNAEPRVPPGFIAALGDCYYLVRRFDAALAAYQSLINASYYFRLLEAACVSQLGRIDEARRIMQEAPADFDVATFARNMSGMCALPEDRELWLEGFRKAGLPE